jgi:integrase
MQGKNPVDAIEKEAPFDEKPEIFAVDDLAKLMNAVTPEFIPVLALGAFTGIRMAELMRLEWKEVNFHTGFVQLPGRKTKSRGHRDVAMPPNLVAWLAPYVGRTGLIWNRSQSFFNHSLQPICKTIGIKWPKNGLRHSYASYHLKKHHNQNLLALDLGHKSGDLIFSNYRALASEKDAERYFNIMPPKQPENIVDLAAA